MAERIHLALWLVGIAAFLWIASPRAHPTQGDVWEPEIRRFEEQDRKTPPPTNQIVFVGASMIVRWDLKKFFPDLTTINRGFGGSEMIDSLHYADRIVIAYKPRIVVVYAGDNDTAQGTSPEQVANHFEALVQKIHGALPQTKIVDISIKPSLARWAIVAKQREANALLRAYCETHDRLAFVDVARLMLGPDSMPRKELYVSDGLHINDEGYKIWTAALRPYLQ